MLETGIKAPGFELPDQNGKIHTLDEYRGRKVILYFYPKDNTAGCTKQACGFAELYPQFTEKGAVIIGVSKDSVASHKKFEEKFNLPFTLLSDTELSCIKAYDVVQGKETEDFSDFIDNVVDYDTFVTVGIVLFEKIVFANSPTIDSESEDVEEKSKKKE